MLGRIVDAVDAIDVVVAVVVLVAEGEAESAVGRPLLTSRRRRSSADGLAGRPAHRVWSICVCMMPLVPAKRPHRLQYAHSVLATIW